MGPIYSIVIEDETFIYKKSIVLYHLYQFVEILSIKLTQFIEVFIVMSKPDKYKVIATRLLYGYSFAWTFFCLVATYNLYIEGATSNLFSIVAVFLGIILTSITLIRKKYYNAAKFILIMAPPYALLIVSVYAKSMGLLSNVFFYLLPRIFVIFTLMAPIIFFGVRHSRKLIISVLLIVPPIFFFEFIHSYFGIELKDLPFKYEYYPKFIGFLSFVYGVPLLSLLFYQLVNIRFKNQIVEKNSIVNEEKNKVLTLNHELESNSNLFSIYEITSRNIPFEEILQEVLDELLTLKTNEVQDRGSILLRDKFGNYEIIAQRNCDSHQPLRQVVSGKACNCDQLIGNDGKSIEANDESENLRTASHSHYIIPINNAAEELGLLNIYINESLEDNIETVSFLEKIADILARRIISVRQVNLLAMKSQEVELQGKRLQLNHEELTESVSYAKLLQTSLLPNVKKMSGYLDDISILFLPKGQIGGDFYFTHKADEHIYFGVGDCTGHGIPGALLAAMSIEAMKSVMNIYCGEKPNFLLEKLRNIAKNRFNVSKSSDAHSDSMDAGLCMYDKKNGLLHYSGGFMNLIIIRDNEILEFQSERCPIGVYPDEKKFSLHSIPMEQNDVIYLASDGYTDQFGYDSSRSKSVKFKKKRYKELILNICKLSCDEQIDILKKNILSWKSGEDQIDDITVMIVKPSTQCFSKNSNVEFSDKLSWKS